MLSISDATYAVFDEQAGERFLRRLLAHERQAHAQRFGGLSDRELARIIAIGVARARAHGLTWESSLAGFIGLMATVSASFDSDPEVIAAMRHRDADAAFASLPDTLSDAAWRRISAQASGVGWYQLAPIPDATIEERVAQALPLAMASVRRVADDEAHLLATTGQVRARAALLGDGEDAAWTCAIACAAYGIDFPDRGAGPWAHTVTDPHGMAAFARTAMLRLRLFLDHRLWV